MKQPVNTIYRHAREILFYTIISFIMAIIFNAASGQDFYKIYYIELLIICASISLSIYLINHFFVGHWFLQLKPLKRALFILADVLISTLIGLLIAQGIIFLFISFDFFFLGTIDVFIGSFVIALIISILAFVYYILQDRITLAQEQIHQAETEKIKLEKLKAEMELELLQGKLNPHFLFNSLNSVASLIRIKPEAAEKMTLQLANLFRALIDSDLRTMHSVSDEFSLLESYLKIEKIRFADRLDYKILNQTTSDPTIPKLILQPLVENAIQHVVAKSKKTELIEISAQEIKGKLELAVLDSGKGFELDESNGYGLKHIHDRLSLIYPDQFEINSSNQHQFKIYIQVPLNL